MRRSGQSTLEARHRVLTALQRLRSIVAEAGTRGIDHLAAIRIWRVPQHQDRSLGRPKDRVDGRK